MNAECRYKRVKQSVKHPRAPVKCCLLIAPLLAVVRAGAARGKRLADDVERARDERVRVASRPGTLPGFGCAPHAGPLRTPRHGVGRWSGSWLLPRKGKARAGKVEAACGTTLAGVTGWGPSRG